MKTSRRVLLATLGGGLVHIALPGDAGAQGRPAKPKPPPKPITLTGATLLLHDATVKDGAVVMQGDRIVYAGADLAKAKAAGSGGDSIAVSGRTITAGFVDLLTQVGIREVSLEPSTVDTAHRTEDPVRAAFRTADGYNPDSSLVRITRRRGLTSVGVVPGPVPLDGEATSGLVSGQSAWADLAGAIPDDALASRSLAMHVHLDDGALGGYAHTRGTVMLRLRELFDDARAYEKNKAAFGKRQLRELATSRLDYEVVNRALKGELPTVVHTDRASDIMNVLTLAKREGLRLVLASCAEGWRVAKHIAKANVPVIVYGLDHGPRSFSARHAREDNAARLHRAGVPIALSTGSSHMARKLGQVAGNAVRAGLPHRAALDAVTRGPAAMMGMTDYGVLEAGKIANVVVWSGDPFELSTRVTKMFIRGRSVSLKSRQTALFLRYFNKTK